MRGINSYLSIRKELAVPVDTRHGYEMIDISKEEIQEWQEEQVESLKEHPEIAQILIANQRQNKKNRVQEASNDLPHPVLL